MVLLDESVRFVVALERYQYTLKMPPEAMPFALQLTRVRSDLISIRELVLLGQESAALAVARVFLEDIELAMAAGVDPGFALAYRDAEKAVDFWSKNIGYGKIYPFVQKFIQRGGGSDDQVAAKLANHKALKSFLSSHIHPTFSSAFRSAYPAALERPGMFFERPLGWVGESLWPLCLFVAEDVYSFSACCINIFIRPSPPSAFAGYLPSGELDDAIAVAHVLQELWLKYANDLHGAHEVATAAWEAALTEDE
jgi:hypothetical protein